MLSAAIFDLDGTLVDVHFDGLAAKRAMITKMSQMGIDVSGVQETQSAQAILDRVPNGSNVSADEIRMEMYRILDHYELRASTKILLRQSALETLHALRKEGLALALVTNSGRRAANEILQKHNIGKFFSVVVTRDDSIRLKPRGDGIALAVSLLKVHPSDAIYIGDSTYDIRAAKEAKVLVAAVLGGVHSTERLMEESHNIVISSLGEIPPLVERLKQASRASVY
ncbi:MAG: HAD family hydrolase [Thaumarchaeota archaeon]|nr:HAD family hydrolase [Nitrososphaerota archaeon]